MSLSPALAYRPQRDERNLLILAALFVGLSALTLSLVETGRLTWAYFQPVVVWLPTMALAWGVIRLRRLRHDPFLLPLFAWLTGWGLILQARLAPDFVERQTLWLALGTGVMTAIAVLPRSLRWLRRYRYTLLLAGLVLLAATLLFGVNPSGFGLALWLPAPFIGGVYFQPSELLKLLLVLFFASYFAERGELLQTDRGRFLPLPYLAPLLLMWGFGMVLLVWQQDLGAATLFFSLCVGLLYLATGKKRYLLLGGALLLVASLIGYLVFDVVALRVDTWWNPWPEADNRAYQIVQSLYALGAGGVAGQGVGQGLPTLVPVVHSDFVLAAIAEEWGLLGALAVVVGLAVWVQRGLYIALRAADTFHFYLAAGLALLLGAQTLLIMGGVTRLLPLTGVTLPFLSYGGSSLLVACVMTGLLLHLSSVEAQDGAALRPADPLTPRRRLLRLQLIFLVAFAVVAVAFFYWGVGRAAWLQAREDNARGVEAELRLRRGTIYDLQGRVLAESVGEERQQRVYPLVTTTEGVYPPGPAVGYYTFRHGAAGVEASLDAILRGEGPFTWAAWQRQLRHLPQVGRSVRLTLDSELQSVAENALGTQTGAVVALALPQGETQNLAALLAMASHPGYDPNQIDAQFETLAAAENAPLLNRATQGVYQPGLLLQPFFMAAALDQSLIQLSAAAPEADRPVTLGADLLTCHTLPPQPATWADALTHLCPAPLIPLAQQWGPAGLAQAMSTFGLTRAPDVPLETAQPAPLVITDTVRAVVGQENVTVTPLQVLLAWTALANQGRIPTPHLVTAIQTPDGVWQTQTPVTTTITTAPAVSALTAQQLVAALPQADNTISFSTLVLSGPNRGTHAWYLGLAPAAAPRVAVVVVVENSPSTTTAAAIGQTLLDAALGRR